MAAALAVVAVVTALLLRFEGRLWICKCGYIAFWIGNTCSSDNSQHIFDPYSFTHILHGVAFFWVVAWVGSRLRNSWQLLVAVVLEAAWEVFENTNFVIERYRTATAAFGYSGDTVVNSLGDIACCVAGFLIAQRLGYKKSIIFFVLVELVLIVWIKDSLLLEILMLTFPINALKGWQTCP